MAKTTYKKTKTPTKKQLIRLETAHLIAKYPDLSRKDADFICRTIADCTMYAAIYISSITDCFSKHSGESDKDFKNRKEHSSIKDMMRDIVNSLGNFMCQNKDFLVDSKEQAASLGKEVFASKLFCEFVLYTFYGECGIADTIESCCYAKLNPPHTPKMGKGKKK